MIDQDHLPNPYKPNLNQPLIAKKSQTPSLFFNAFSASTWASGITLLATALLSELLIALSLMPISAKVTLKIALMLSMPIAVSTALSQLARKTVSFPYLRHSIFGLTLLAQGTCILLFYVSPDKVWTLLLGIAIGCVPAIYAIYIRTEKLHLFLGVGAWFAFFGRMLLLG